MERITTAIKRRTATTIRAIAIDCQEDGTSETGLGVEEGLWEEEEGVELSGRGDGDEVVGEDTGGGEGTAEGDSKIGEGETSRGLGEGRDGEGLGIGEGDGTGGGRGRRMKRRRAPSTAREPKVPGAWREIRTESADGWTFPRTVQLNEWAMRPEGER